MNDDTDIAIEAHGFAFTNNMRQVSGFGGSYERGCRAMILAGAAWLRDNPDSNPVFTSPPMVFGMATAENQDAKDLDRAMMDSEVIIDGKPVRAGDHATGAMCHAAANHVMFIKKNGWPRYVEEMTKPQS